MDLRGFEANVTTGNPVVGATVNVREANLITPNVTSVLSTTTTDANGVWAFTGLSDTPKDIDITYTGQHWGYRGLTQVSTSKVYTETAADGTVPWPLIPNAGFESWISGVGPVSLSTTPVSVADTWTGSTGTGSTGSVTREATIKASASDYSAKLIFSRVAGVQRVYRILTTEQVSALRGKALSTSMQYRQGVASNTRLFVEDSAGTTYSTAVATTGSILTAIAKRTIDSAATKVWVGVEQAASDTAYVDNFAILVGTPDAVYGPQALGAGSIEDYLIGSRTPDQTVAATSGALSITNAFSMLANRIKAIAGTTNWYDAVSVALTGMVSKAGDTMTGTLSLTTAANSISAAGTIVTSSASANSIVTSGGISAAGTIASSGALNGASASITNTSTATVHNGTLDVRVGGTSVLSRATHVGTQAASTISDLSTAILARSQHTGTQLAATISDFATAAAAAAGVPLGAVVWFETLAELTAAGASWQRYTAADGLLLNGAGTSGGQTFSQATNSGATWTPAASISASSSTITASGSVAASVQGGGSSAAATGHTHPAPTITVSGGSTVWVPPLRTGIWGRKI